MVILFLLGINILTGDFLRGDVWFLYPASAILLSVGIHYIASLGTYKVDQLARRWEEYEQSKVNDSFENRKMLSERKREDRLDLEELERLREIELEDRDLV